MGTLAQIVAAQSLLAALMAAAGKGVQYLRTPAPAPLWRPHPSNEGRQWDRADLAHYLATECPGAKPDPPGVVFPNGSRLAVTKHPRVLLARDTVAGPPPIAASGASCRDAAPDSVQ